MARHGGLPEHGMTVVAFSEHGKTETEWNHNLNRFEQIYTTTVTNADDTKPSKYCQLSSETSTEAIKVVEINFPSSAPFSLSECSTFCKSDPVERLSNDEQVTFVVQPISLFSLHRKPGLAVFDMDSTLIQQEVIDELARAIGLYDRVAAITEAAMRGEAPYTDFEASLRARVALLKGVPIDIWDQLKKSIITFTPGAHELVKTLKALGWKTAVLSGGFTPLANWVKESLGLDYAYANHLSADETAGILTGELVPGKPIIHAEKKRELLKEIAAREDIPLERVIAVGDGSNDLLMMSVAGLGIAFNAKPKVQKAAPVSLRSKTLLDVMYILGYTLEDVDGLLSKSAAAGQQ